MNDSGFVHQPLDFGTKDLRQSFLDLLFPLTHLHRVNIKLLGYEATVRTFQPYDRIKEPNERARVACQDLDC